jgi:NAD(P)H-dependent FMN reductase
MPLTIAVITGSVRPNRFNDKPAQWIAELAAKLPDVEVEFLDVKDYDLPFYDEPMGPSMLNKQYSHDSVKAWSQKIEKADAYIIVTPEYNHSTSAVLKNALDAIFPEWNNKPVGFVSYGSVGGARAVEHLRLIAVELMMAPIRNAVHIPGHKFFPILMGQAEWKPEEDESLMKAAHAMLEQLVWWTKALKHAREQK